MKPHRPFGLLLASLPLAFVLLTGLAGPVDAEDRAPVTVLATSGGDEQEVRVTLAFSRKVEYRLEETRNRLRVMIEDPLDEQNLADVELGGEILKRIRFDSGKRSSQIVFQTGTGFGSFILSEQDDPFRLVVVFRSALIGKAPGEPAPTLSAERAAVPYPDNTSPSQQPAPLPPHAADEIRNIVLDPGHGGVEDGAIGPLGLKEKDLVLDIARRLRQALAERGYNVAMTREEDRDVGLEARTSLANYLGADLFLSIHANASSRRGARGAESYFLAWDAGDAAESGGAADAGGGMALDEPLNAVLWEMAQVRHLGQSSRLAGIMQEELNRATAVRDRGVKQAPFRVLVGAMMPAILVEVGFLTDRDEEANLSSQEYRERIVLAMASAVDRFRDATGRDDQADNVSSPDAGTPR